MTWRCVNAPCRYDDAELPPREDHYPPLCPVHGNFMVEVRMTAPASTPSPTSTKETS